MILCFIHSLIHSFIHPFIRSLINNKYSFHYDYWWLERIFLIFFIVNAVRILNERKTEKWGGPCEYYNNIIKKSSSKLSFKEAQAENLHNLIMHLRAALPISHTLTLSYTQVRVMGKWTRRKNWLLNVDDDDDVLMCLLIYKWSAGEWISFTINNNFCGFDFDTCRDDCLSLSVLLHLHFFLFYYLYSISFLCPMLTRTSEMKMKLIRCGFDCSHY